MPVQRQALRFLIRMEAYLINTKLPIRLMFLNTEFMVLRRIDYRISRWKPFGRSQGLGMMLIGYTLNEIVEIDLYESLTKFYL